MARKTLLLAAACCLVPMLGHAAGRDDLMRALSNCAALSVASSRLACYDRLAPEFGKTLAEPAPVTRAEKERQFGQERLERTPEQVVKAKEEEVDSIAAHLADYALNPFGKFTVFLDNGQIWSQLQSDPGKAHFSRDPHRVTVRIERAIFGTYSMTISDNTKLFKVKRVK